MDKRTLLRGWEKCQTRSEFITRYYGAYSSSVKNGWYDEVSAHMTSPVKPIKWTKEQCLKAGKSCKTKAEFIKNIVAHMQVL